jgi:3-methyl-2-oxobutanoate hydroxymethyltransferase
MKKTIRDFKLMKKREEPITWVTAYDYPTAYCAEQSGIDMILVGDSGGMVQLGYETTNSVTMDEMLVLAKAARRGAPNTFIVGDMPQGTYEVSNEDAVKNALRFIKEAGCDAIKLEGGLRVASRIEAIVDAGIIVIGHLGLTPQSSQSFGGYRVQGKTVESFNAIIEDAIILEKTGINLLLLEAMPTESAEKVAQKLKIPVLGIGAGNKIDGQLLIMHDLLGLYPAFRPKFAQCFVSSVINKYQDLVSEKSNFREFGIETRNDGLLFIIQSCLTQYINDVKNRSFPNEDYSYNLSNKSLAKLQLSNYWEVN